MSGPITRRIRIWPAALLAVTATAAMQAGADTFYVNGSCGNDAWTGTNSVCSAPNGPKLTIQAGISASVDGDTVIVADGTYTGFGNRDLDFAGRDIHLRSASRDPTQCIIDWQGTAGDPHRGFYFHSYETPDAVIEGFTIQNGFHPDYGGAVACHDSRPTIRNCRFVGNRVELVDGVGGAIAYFNSYASVLVEGCVFLENEARYGGAVSADQIRLLVIRSCTIRGNTAGIQGGGIIASKMSLLVEDCVIEANAASMYGGGIASLGGCMTVRASRISANRGGGIRGQMGELTMVVTLQPSATPPTPKC